MVDLVQLEAVGGQSLSEGFSGEVDGNQVTLLHDGVQCFPAMLRAISEAQREILLEMYWFGSDTIGRRIAAALCERARDGLKVRVLYDAVGSLEAAENMFDEMREAGVEVSQYNPIAPWRLRFKPERLTRRNHRKMLVVDGCVGLTGGVNIGDQWLPTEEGGGGWRDDMIRLEGPAVKAMRDIFAHGWREMEKGGLAGFGNGDRILPDASRHVNVLANHYFGERRAIRATYLRRIRRARTSVFITNSYFLPDRTIRHALASAAGRGVEVRVLVPGISDVKAVYYAGRKLYPWLHKRGVRVHEWLPQVLHAKTAVIDGEWCTVGTYNLDYLSWRSNLEVTVAIDDPAVSGALHKRFLQDLQQSREIDRTMLASRTWTDRILEDFFFLFYKFL